MIVDLHCHTAYSDGSLMPDVLLARAVERGVTTLAITDHDTIEGSNEAKLLLAQFALDLIAGTELSCLWQGRLIHIVGLAIDVKNPVLTAGLAQLAAAREERSELIAERLESKGFTGVLAGAKQCAGKGVVGRPHFAHYLVASGQIKSAEHAFKHYLGAGKIGDVKAYWPDLADCVSWIVAAGGIAVLAHPMQYKLTQTKLRSLLTDFMAAGGKAMEVVSGVQTSSDTTRLAALCNQFGLLASAGSDFHGPGVKHRELGVMSALPESCEPVWEHWNLH